jgi:putative copper resistance protein D
VAWLVGTAAYVAGADGPAEAIAAVPAVVTYMGFGKLLLARLVLLGLAVGLLLDRAARPLIALAPAALAVALQPLMGHAGAIGAVVPIGAGMLHLLAVAVWIGGLLPLLVSLAGDSPGTWGRTLRRFSILGAVAVGTIAASGATMGAALAGGLRGLLGTEYGLALQLKTGLFAAALALAALNRFVLAGRLDEVEPGTAPALLRALRLSIAAELGLGLVIVLTAGILASLPPGAERMASSLAWAPILTALAVQALATAVVAALWVRCHVFRPHLLRSDPR